MRQKGLTVLGLMARAARTIGLGSFLQLSRDITDSMLLKTGKPPLKICLDGHVICGCFRHRSFLHHLSWGNYEAFTVELFTSHLRSGMTVVDGGSHIGFYTLLAAQLVGSSGRVYSFEPDPYNYECLVFNILKNNYQNVNMIQKALSNRNENTTFYQASGTISSSIGDRVSSNTPYTGCAIKKITVQSTTSDLELGNPSVDLIKLDIEGAEPLALEGRSKTINNKRSLVLFIEINPSALYSLRGSPKMLIRSLRDFGFDISYIDESRSTLIPLTEESPISKGNLFCKRS